MAEMHPKSSEYSNRQVRDATGGLYPVGPDLADTEAARSLLAKWGRDIGRLAVFEGVQLEVLLGMLDAGLDLSRVISALVMHGDLNAEHDDDADHSQVLLTERDGVWQIATPRAS